MLDVLRKKNLPEAMLKHFLFFALFFPVFTSEYESPYAPDLIVVNVFAFLFVAAAVLHKRVDWKERNYFGYVLLLLLAVYNVAALYANVVHLQWFSSQFNVTVPFLMFLALVFMEKDSLAQKDDIIRFFLQAVVVSNLIGFVVYFLGNYGVWLMNGKIGLVPVEPDFYERRYNWIYLHKSQYAFMLVLFLGLMVTYRRLFRNRWTYLGSLAVMVVGLVISNTVTSMFAALFIFMGQFADRVFWKDGRFQPKRLLWLIPVAAVLAVGLWLVAQKRNIFTLGGRVYIWSGGMEVLRENPLGTGRMCGLITYPIMFPGYTDGYNVINLHNVFLNLLLQFSIPAGLVEIGMLATIALVSLKRNLSFTTLGIWAALLIPMMMDWCILLTDLPMFLLGIYYIFFSPLRKKL